MAVHFTNTTQGNKAKKRSGHVQPRKPVIDLDGDGRLRTAHVLALAGISHSTLYKRVAMKTFPQPDGNDGRNFWFTQTIRAHLCSPCGKA